MKILQFTPYLAPHKGGLEKIAETLSQYLVETGEAEVINITSSILQQEQFNLYPPINYQNKHIGYRIKNYEVIPLPSFEIVHNFPCPKIWTVEFRLIMKYIKQQKPDFIQTHTRFFLQTMLGGIVAKWLKKPRIHIEHGSGYVTGYAAYIKLCAAIFDNTIGRRIFRQSDKIITISKANIPFIQKFTQKPVTVIYNPIDYTPQENTENTVPHIGFIGRLVSLKGIDLLIQALKHLEHKPRKCSIIGEGDQKEVLENLVKELHLSDRIDFIGRDDRANWLHTFDIFVNPSYQEGLPTTVIEALLAKCIVIATNVGGTKEISDQKDLIIIDKGNISDVQKGLELAIKEKDSLKGLSYDKVKNTFNWQTSIKKYAEIYKEILK